MDILISSHANKETDTIVPAMSTAEDPVRGSPGVQAMRSVHISKVDDSNGAIQPGLTVTQT